MSRKAETENNDKTHTKMLGQSFLLDKCIKPEIDDSIALSFDSSTAVACLKCSSLQFSSFTLDMSCPFLQVLGIYNPSYQLPLS